jgi:hypothetical protein
MLSASTDREQVIARAERQAEEASRRADQVLTRVYVQANRLGIDLTGA